MSNNKLPWFRLYTEMVDDEKLRLVAFEDRWHFVALLCLKGSGLLDDDCSDDLKKRRVAVKLGLSVGELEMVARRLAEVELIDRDTLQPLGWDVRQFPSDSSSARVKAYRERQKNKAQSDETDVKRYSNGLDTDTDTDTDKDTDKEQKQDAREAQAPAPAAPAKAKTKIDFDFETGQFTGVTEVQIKLWQDAFPAISLDAERAKAAAWLIANPANRKSNYAAFLTRWFTKAQDSAPAQVISLHARRPAPTVHQMPSQYGKSGRL